LDGLLVVGVLLTLEKCFLESKGVSTFRVPMPGAGGYLEAEHSLVPPILGDFPLEIGLGHGSLGLRRVFSGVAGVGRRRLGRLARHLR